jgi:hypothetical protein
VKALFLCRSPSTTVLRIARVDRLPARISGAVDLIFLINKPNLVSHFVVKICM